MFDVLVSFMVLMNVILFVFNLIFVFLFDGGWIVCLVVW